LNRLPAFPADGAVRAPSLAYLFRWKRVIAARLCGGLGETALVSWKNAIVLSSLRVIGPVKGPAAEASAAGAGGRT